MGITNYLLKLGDRDRRRCLAASAGAVAAAVWLAIAAPPRAAAEVFTLAGGDIAVVGEEQQIVTVYETRSMISRENTASAPRN
jgi:ApbE superfamily uncharacterized protein (UPF0280 family)